jgi:chromate reductase
MKVLGISGSLRKASYNTMALLAAQKLAPQDMEITVADIGAVPMYNEDLRAQAEPAAVKELKASIRAADGILLVCPEYNFSIPGVLKNTLDWLSRPPELPFEGKPVAIMGASAGPMGSSRAQYHLRQVLVYLNAFTVNRPEVFIGSAQTKFNAEGSLVDESTSKFIAELLVALQQLKQRIG